MKEKIASEPSPPPAKVVAPPSHTIVPQDAAVATLSGLYLAGQVVGRRRSTFPQKEQGRVRYNIAIAVLTSAGRHNVERWTENPNPPDTPNLGDTVCIPVTLVHFTNSRGSGTRLAWGPTDRGEEF